MASLSHPILTEWHKRWYSSGKKIVCREDVENWLDPLALAVWFYDDGHIVTSERNYRAHLYTLSFSFDDVTWLSELLKSRFNIECSPSQLKKYWAITLPRVGRDRLIEIIKNHPAPGMEYKLNPPQLKTPWWLRH